MGLETQLSSIYFPVPWHQLECHSVEPLPVTLLKEASGSHHPAFLTSRL